MARNDWFKMTETADGVQFTIKQRRKKVGKFLLGILTLMFLGLLFYGLETSLRISVLIFGLGFIFFIFFFTFLRVWSGIFSNPESVFTVSKDRITFQKKPYKNCPSEVMRSDISHIFKLGDFGDEKIGFNYRGNEVFIVRALSAVEADFLYAKLSKLMNFADAVVSVR